MSNFTQNMRRRIDRRPILWNSLLAAAALVVLGFLTLLFLDLWTHHGSTAVVPELKNLSLEDATAKLDDNDLSIQVNDSVYMSDIPDSLMARKPFPGMILESWPKAGAVVKGGRPVYVTIVAYSAKEVVMTSPIDNISSRQAISLLQSMGIHNIRIVRVPSQYDDNVERALYNGKTITVGTALRVNGTVTLEVGQAYDENQYSAPAPADSAATDIPVTDEPEIITADDQL